MGCWRTLDEAVEQLHQHEPGKLFGAYNTLIRECGNARSLSHGRQVHQHIVSTGYGGNQALGDLLVQMYGRCGSVQDAKATFDQLPSRQASSWNFMVRAYAQQRDTTTEAFDVFDQMVSQEQQVDGSTLARVLALCRGLGDLERGKALHEQAVNSGLANNPVVQKALVSMYSKCKALEKAKEIFEKSSKRELGVWNAMIVGYAQNGHHLEALKLYKRMELEPNGVTISSILGACSNVGELEEGRKIYARGKHLKDLVVDTAAVNMFGKCGDLETARQIFDGMELKNEVTWNSMMAVYVYQGRSRDALHLFEKMKSTGIKPSSSTYATVVHACSDLSDVTKGTTIHSEIVKASIRQTVILQTALVTLYVRLGMLDFARGLFDKMEEKNVVVYNVMISALSQRGLGKEALELYKKMVHKGIRPEAATFCSALGACSGVADLEEGKLIELDIKADECKTDVRVLNALMSMYGRCGNLEAAKDIFDTRDERDEISWNAMISAYAKNGQARKAVDLFYQMAEQQEVEMGEVTFSTALYACSILGEVDECRKIHRLLSTKKKLVASVEVNVSLINMYSECQRLDLAGGVFGKNSWPCPGPWLSMVAALVKNGRGDEALETMERMQLEGWKPEAVTFGLVLSSCSSLRDGRTIHSIVTDNGYVRLRPVADGLLSMYSRCGELQQAREIFDGMEARSVVTWTLMISAYEQRGLSREALDLFYAMKDVESDDILYSTVFGACATLGVLAEGRAIHEQIKERKVQLGVFGATGLMNMYAKCGKIQIARDVFEEMGTFRTYVSWTSIITAYSHRSQADETLELSRRMVQEGVMPDGITFISVLMATSESPDSTMENFRSMTGDYCIEPMLDHYECLVDVLSRAGWAREAEALAMAMPFTPRPVTWTTLLGACKLHGETKRGVEAARSLLELGFECSSSYVLLSNLVAG
ncbi:pentatricopeptide repeat-containing protein At3g09040, mitochondrial isoform X2 [Selaginella moellendorffii]|nr:pentatricopeptide repeat-containing protein At3g09040, mitochondrial isoform X2 [Selaginella moellendorffii]|eukprot:XP_024525376.1 pentatricopeptide repeat-containing protein At3g09040, mitochondrial isoform X2 [Selaginella moellendorffii]